MHEKKFSKLENFQANTIVFQTNINATLTRNTFPNNTEVNPKDLTPTAMRGNNELQGSKKM